MSCTCNRYSGPGPCPICQRQELENEEALRYGREPVLLQKDIGRRPYPYCKGMGRPNQKDCTNTGECDCR